MWEMLQIQHGDLARRVSYSTIGGLGTVGAFFGFVIVKGVWY